MGKVYCATCGKECKRDGISTGYGVDRDGNKICYACIGLQDAKAFDALEIGGRTALYLTKNNNAWSVTNWPGTFSVSVSTPKQGRHNMARVRYDTWFKYNGKFFHGVQYGDMTQICHIRRVKPW